jgi:hypothetical protein
MKIKKTLMIESSDWDALVIKTYGRPYCFQQQDGCKQRGIEKITVPDEEWGYDHPNETVPEEVNHREMAVSFASWLSRDPSLPLEGSKYEWETPMWWERNFYPHVQMVANDLHKRGLLEAGDYVINIDW